MLDIAVPDSSARSAKDRALRLHFIATGTSPTLTLTGISKLRRNGVSQSNSLDSSGRWLLPSSLAQAGFPHHGARLLESRYPWSPRCFHRWLLHYYWAALQVNAYHSVVLRGKNLRCGDRIADFSQRHVRLAWAGSFCGYDFGHRHVWFASTA